MTQVRKYEPSSHNLRMVIYGSSGIGKTVFGNTAPNPLFLSAEEGLLSLADKGVNYVKIETTQDIDNIYHALKNGSLKDDKGKKIKVDTVVIDSLTEVQQVIINNITGGGMPSQRQWGDFSTKMAEILRKFKGLDVHLIFICLENEKNDEDDNGRDFSRFVPELYGKLMQKTCAMMDMVGRYYMKTTVVNDKPTAQRVMTFEYSPRHVAKDRSGKLPAFVDPDFTKLLEACKIKVKKEKILAKVEDAPDSNGVPAAIPTEPITPEQSKLMFSLWNTLIKEGVIKKEEGDTKRRMTIKQLYGVDSSTKLTKKQAMDFIDKLGERIGKTTGTNPLKLPPVDAPGSKPAGKKPTMSDDEVKSMQVSLKHHKDVESLNGLWNVIEEYSLTEEQRATLEKVYNAQRKKITQPKKKKS